MPIVGNPIVVPSVTVGGVTFTDLTNLIVLSATVNTTGTYSVLRNIGTTTAYTPSGSNKFNIWAARALIKVDTVDGVIRLIYANASLGNNNAGPPSGNQGPSRTDEAADAPIFSLSTTNFSRYPYEIGFGGKFQVPNGKFPHIRGDGTISGIGIILYGYEVP